MEVRITFRSEIFFKGDSLDDIREQWENLGLFSAEALTKHYAEYIETNSAEIVDGGEYIDITNKF